MRHVTTAWMLSSALAGLTPVLGAQTAASLKGRVLADSTEAPLAGAEVTVGAAGPRARTDSLGQFRIAGIQPGSHLVVVRRLGFAPATSTVQLAPGDSLEADFLLAPQPLVLGEVAVTAALVERKLRSFEGRRMMGIGSFMDEEELVKAPGTRMSEKLRHFPGMHLVYPRAGGSHVQVASARGQQSIMLQRKGPCLAAIMLDGVTVGDFSVNSLDPGSVAAVEWYSGPAQMPAEYNATRNTCGLLVIWTK